MKKKQTEQTFEEKIAYLETIAKGLECENISINDIITTYKDASKVIQICKQEIEEIEQSIIEISTK